MNKILDQTLLNSVNIFDGHSDLNFSSVESISRVFSYYDNGLEQPSVCILLGRSSLYIASILAAWRAGFYVVPLNTAWPIEKNAEIINRIKPTLVLAEDEFDISKFSVMVLTKKQLLKKEQDLKYKNFTLRPIKSNDIAYIIFTSGSTGEPKGVVITAQSYRAYIDWTRNYFKDYSHIQKLLLTSELTFDITMGDIAFGLAFGTDIGVARQHVNIPSVLSMIMKYKIDLLYSVPTTHLALLLFSKKKKGSDISSLKLIMSGGDSFPWKMIKDYSEMTKGAHIYNVYGPTEVTINCFSIRLDDKVDELSSKNKPVPIGECFDTLDFVLMNDGVLSKNEGELCIVGSQIMLGYYKGNSKIEDVVSLDPRVTGNAKQMYHTGDLAYVDDGLVYLRGRLDSLVKIKGYRIHPDEVSKIIDTLSGIDTSVVISKKFDNEYKLVAFIKLNKNLKINIEKLKKSLCTKLPDYMVPYKYKFVNDFPLNQSGKIDKEKLKSLVK
jgi:D-alanine--poly(phosphoribitol) ligase subunit 1